MPNNIRNKLQFIGDKKEVEEIRKFIRSKEHVIDFNKIIKMPDEILEAYETDCNESWYDWCVENWGTKWDAYDEYADVYDYSIIKFSTATNPPFKIIKELSRKFPTITLKHSFLTDPIDKFRASCNVIKNGIIIEEFEIPTIYEF